MKKAATFLLALVVSLGLAAQESRRITGIVADEETGQPVIQAGVELLAARDSARLDIVVTDLDGKFAIRANPGDYILKVSYIGCTTVFIPVHQSISQLGLDLGTVLLPHESLSLDAAVVSAKADPVTVKGDTVVYNAAAFPVAEDADLDELLKKIPGLEVEGSGAVYLHGRQITQLMVNGKRYFGGDVKTGLKNIPAAMVENIRAYDRPSEQARLSGVDDGESEPVLDLSIKKSMMDGWQNNINLGGGTQRRHNARINANKITKTEQQTLLASSHNIIGKASINTTSRNQMGTGGSGDAIFTSAGYTFSKESEKLETAGHFQYSNSDRNVESRGRAQSLQTSGTTFSNANGLRIAAAPVIKGDFSVDWKKDKVFTMLAKAVFQYDENNYFSSTRGRSFNADPYTLDPDPNGYLDFDVPGDPFKAIRVNATRNDINNSTAKYNGSLTVTASWRHPKIRRRNLTLRGFVQAYGNNSGQTGHYLTRYYRIKANPDSVLTRSNFTDNKARVGFTYLQASFNNPLVKRWNYQVIFRTDYLRQRQGKEYYDFGALIPDWTAGEGLGRRKMLNALPSGYEAGFQELFSAEALYERVVVPVTFNIFRNEKKYNFLAGVVLREQLSWLHCNGDLVRRNSFDVSPNFNFKYRFNKSSQLSVVYRSWVAGASVGQMLPITNGTNPLYISIGNPYLLSPVVHNANINFNSSNKAKQNSFTANLTYNNTYNAISTSTVYDEESGVRTSTPKNIDGNWKINGSMAATKTLTDNRFSLTNQTGAEYQNNVSFLYNNKLRKDETNVFGRLMIKDRMEGSFRCDWLEILLNGGIEYTDERSLLRPEMSQRPISWIAGVSTLISFPWKMRLETDFTSTFQRGWSYEELNKNYYIWNAELTQRIMNGRATLRLGWYDILRSQDNLTRSLSASSRSVYLYNGVASYVMLRFFYRFKL